MCSCFVIIEPIMVGYSLLQMGGYHAGRLIPAAVFYCLFALMAVVIFCPAGFWPIVSTLLKILGGAGLFAAFIAFHGDRVPTP